MQNKVLRDALGDEDRCVPVCAVVAVHLLGALCAAAKDCEDQAWTRSPSEGGKCCDAPFIDGES